MDKQGLCQARAEVIEKFINLEWLVNAIISQHYFGKVMLPFVLEVLYDEYFSFGLKRGILQKIVRDIDARQIERLNRLNTIRNHFAHRGQEIFSGPDIPSKGQLGVVPDPRRLDKPIDFTQLYEEFQRTEPSVAEYLFELYKRLGGEYRPRLIHLHFHWSLLEGNKQDEVALHDPLVPRELVAPAAHNVGSA